MTKLSAYWTFLAAILQESITLFLLAGACLGVVAGLLLLLDSARALRISARLNRWVSTRAAMRPLEAHRSIKRPLYRHHRLAGALICAGALYSAIVLASPYGAGAIARSLGALGPQKLGAWLAESLTLVLVAGNIAALLFGLVFVFRPSALKGLEAWADRQVSGRRPTRPLEEQRYPLDAFAHARPRLLGALVLIGSLFVLASVGYPMLR